MSDALVNVVLIAKKNTSLHFLRALRSVLSQTYAFIEVWVADVNEPDSLYSLGLQEDLQEFSQVKYVKLEPSLSLAQIRNQLLKSMEGEYTSYLASDDVWHEDKVLRQVKELEENPRAVACCCGGILLDERKQEVCAEILLREVEEDTSFWFLHNPARMASQVVYRTEALRESGGFDGQFLRFQDGDMIIRLGKEDEILFLRDDLCECHITPEHKTYDEDNFKDGQKIIYKYVEYFLVNRAMAQDFYGYMLKLAGKNYVWLHYLIYTVMYFLKGPARASGTALQKGAKLIYYMIKWCRRTSSLFGEFVKMKWHIHLVKDGKLDRIKALSYTPPMDRETRGPMEFASSQEYNLKGALDFAFDSKLTSIAIPEYVTVIKKYMFYGCEELLQVMIPSTVLKIEPHAFHKCKNLRYVLFEEGSRLGKIGEYAFAGCQALRTMNLPSNMVKIGKYAFAECSSLRQLLFTHLRRGEEVSSRLYPTALRRLSPYVFMGCTNLQAVEFGDNSMLKTIDTGAFLGCSRLQSVVLTGKVSSMGNFSFAYCKQLYTLAIPQIDALKRLGSSVFMHCESIDYFLFPNQLEKIPMRAFYACKGLRVVKIPKKVLSINHQAFDKCTSLTNAIIMSGDTAISPTAFGKHTKVEFIGPGNKTVSSGD